MGSGNNIYKKPFITAAAFIILGIFAIISGIYFEGSTGNSGYFAMVALGVFFIIIGAVVFSVYGMMEMKFKAVINNNKILDFTLNDETFNSVAIQTGEEVKQNNKALLFIMLAFCVSFGLISLFLFEDGIILFEIFIGLGIFLTIMALIITKYRLSKIKKGSKRVILSKNAAYVAGEFHTWNMPDTALLGARYVPRDGNNVKMGYIEIQYGAVTVPGPSTYSFIVPIPAEFENRANEIVQTLLMR